MSTSPRFISLEGLSGVGKSTVLQLLAEELKAEIVATVPKEFTNLRRFMDCSDRSLINARFCFFLSAVLYSEEKIRMVLAGGRSVVAESHLYRTIAFHRGMGSELSIGLPTDILMPNPVFHLVCEDEERRRRRKERVKAETFWDRLAEQHTVAVLREYYQFSMTYVDTTRRSPEAVVAFIQEVLQRSGQ